MNLAGVGELSEAGLAVEQAHGPVGDSVAIFSRARTHRYLLARTWSRARPMVVMMLNPSTADATVDDPTIRRCIRFAVRERAGGLVVANLFGLRATDPAALVHAGDPVGPGNDAVVAAIATGQVVVAWGATAYEAPLRHRARAATADLRSRGASLHGLGLTPAGHPRHPLYLRATAPLTPWHPPEIVLAALEA